MRDPQKNVTFVFKCYEKESADLKIRLRYDGLKQGEFFRSVLKMYIAKDPLMMSLVEKIKEDQKTMGLKRRRITIKDIKKGEEMLKDLGITPADKKDIFDMIEAGALDDG